MEIKQLEYVIMSADMGSFNKASEFLYTTQSNVSKVIRKLERELGYEIFRRQGNGVALTDAGKLFYEQAQQILKMLRRIEDFKDLSHKTCLHIASMVSNFVATHFAQFAISHNAPDYCLKMWEGSIKEVIELVECAEAELGFVYIGEKQYSSFQTYLQRRGLYFTEVLPAQVEVCIGRKNPLRGKRAVKEKELRDLKFVSLLEDAISKNYHLHQLEQKLHLEKNMADAIQVNSNCALMNILAVTDRTYLCYGTVMDTQVIEPDAEGIQTLPVVFENEQEKVYLGYVHKREEGLSDLGEQLLEEIRKGYAGED